MEVSPQKIKNRTDIMMQQSQLWVLTPKSEARNLKCYLHSHVHCSITHNSQDMEST